MTHLLRWSVINAKSATHMLNLHNPNGRIGGGVVLLGGVGPGWCRLPASRYTRHQLPAVAASTHRLPALAGAACRLPTPEASAHSMPAVSGADQLLPAPPAVAEPDPTDPARRERWRRDVAADLWHNRQCPLDSLLAFVETGALAFESQHAGVDNPPAGPFGSVVGDRPRQ